MGRRKIKVAVCAIVSLLRGDRRARFRISRLRFDRMCFLFTMSDKKAARQVGNSFRLTRSS
jgi:hypothetical protein